MARSRLFWICVFGLAEADREFLQFLLRRVDARRSKGRKHQKNY
jgi:hypothetical protein